MWERSKENPHLYIWLCKEKLLRMTVHNKKLWYARQQAQKQENRKWKKPCGEKCDAKEVKELMLQCINIRENKEHMEERENLQD